MIEPPLVLFRRGIPANELEQPQVSFRVAFRQVIAVEMEGQLERWLVIETKGDQLAGNLDTEYKRAVLDKLSTAYAKPASTVGQLTLFERRAAYRCALIAEDNWETEVRAAIASYRGEAIIDQLRGDPVQ